MEDYPAFSLDHNTPLLVALGLPADAAGEGGLDPDLRAEGLELRSDAPLLQSDQAAALLQYMEDKDASDLPWNGRDAASRKYGFRVKSVGRTCTLPPRRAKLPENFDPPPSPPTLHSPFSPLSPACHLYPDGLIDSRWLRKHHDLIPSVLLCFYSLAADPNLASLEDNKIKSDINRIKSILATSGYKTRLAVVLLHDQGTRSGHDDQERLETIRRGCGLDTKAFFSIPPEGSQEELERIVDNALVILYSQAVEYYRDLGRHARKKRGRGVAPQPTVPPTSGTSQTLALAGWNVRYDFKSAIFAEFRQEMDMALKSFDQAYETLLSAEVLDIIPSWSPRWNEARLLADVIAVRSLRCLLWNGQHSAAVRRWQLHRDRICDFVDRRGRGTDNYGWKAWEARWAVMMANLIERAEIPEFRSTDKLFLSPEKHLLGERLLPWELLHHPGYWYCSAARHIYGRRAFAHAIPDDDRRSPSFSPASRIASKAYTYDTYMCPEPYEEYPLDQPGVNYSQLIVDYLMNAKREFQRRDQTRFCAEISLDCAKELTRMSDWRNAVEMLEPFWDEMAFRSQEWLDITEDLAWTLRAAAVQSGRLDLVVAIDWELLNKKFTKRSDWHYDLTRAAEGVTTKSKPSIELSDEFTASCLECSFSFRTEEGKAGEACLAQLSITSNARSGSAPIILDNLRIDFEGSLKAVVIEQDPEVVVEQGPRAVRSIVTLEETYADESLQDTTKSESESGKAILQGKARLTLAPGRTTTFEMAIPLREPSEANASSLKLSLECEDFSLSYTSRFLESKTQTPWFLSANVSRMIPRSRPHAIHILPRPPKMEIKLSNQLQQYYTNEAVELHIEILNDEDAGANPRLDVSMFGEDAPAFRLRVADGDETTASCETEESRVPTTTMEIMKSSSARRVIVAMDPIERSTGFDLTVKVSYNLVTDPATPIEKAVIFPLSFINPFEANYDLLPRLHSDPWPSVFDFEGLQDLSDDQAVVQPRGIAQARCLVTRFASFALEDLKVTSLDVRTISAPEVRCHATTRTEIPPGGLIVSPKTIEEAQFDLVAQRLSLDDRSHSNLDVSFVIGWSRVGADASGGVGNRPVNTTILPVPRLNVFGTEPRVLASVSYAPPPSHSGLGDGAPSLVILEVTIENASGHFLTFGLSMEPSDDFAFSGAKQTTLHLLPVSRRSVTYRLVPLVRGAWVRPALVVRDKYFQKILRIIPTEGMKLDKDGFLVWFPTLEEKEEEDEDVNEGGGSS